MSDTQARRLRIQGRVQGVGYRAWLAQAAQAAGVHGWVRNRRDGSVEALLTGPADAVAALAAACARGPDGAAVTGIDESAAQGMVPERFEVKPTV